jgi:hypothetical protein
MQFYFFDDKNDPVYKKKEDLMKKYLLIALLMLSVVQAQHYCSAVMPESSRQHLPLMMLLDYDSKDEASGIKPSALKNFVKQISDNNSKENGPAVVVSRNLLLGYAHMIKDALERKKSNINFFAPSEWAMYSSNDSDLFIIIPKGSDDFFNLCYKAFNISGEGAPFSKFLTPEQENLVTQKNPTVYQSIIDRLIQEPSPDRYCTSKNLKSLFRPLDLNAKEVILFDIYIVGHGSELDRKNDFDIAGLKKHHFFDFLNIINKEIKTGILMVMSCFAGEKIEHINSGIRPENKSISKLLFPIIISSVDARTTYENPIDISKIFYYARMFDQDSKVLKMLFKYLDNSLHRKKDHQASSSIPQIIFPGGISVQSLTPEDRVTVIGDVFTRIHEQENREIITYQKRVLQKSIKNKKSSYEVMYQEKKAVTNILIYPSVIYPPVRIKSFSKMFFPVIISMDHRVNAHYYFSKIILDKRTKTDDIGIFKFIQDAFCKQRGRISKKTILIELLEGKNDFLSYFSEDSLSKEDYGKIRKIMRINTGLKNVIVATDGRQEMSNEKLLSLFNYTIECTLPDLLTRLAIRHSESVQNEAIKAVNTITISDLRERPFEKRFQNLKQACVSGDKALYGFISGIQNQLIEIEKWAQSDTMRAKNFSHEKIERSKADMLEGAVANMTAHKELVLKFQSIKDRNELEGALIDYFKEKFVSNIDFCNESEREFLMRVFKNTLPNVISFWTENPWFITQILK